MGAHASINPSLTFEDNNVDIVIGGEGEYTFLYVVGRIKNGEILLNLDYFLSLEEVSNEEAFALLGETLACSGTKSKNFICEELQQIMIKAYKKFFFNNMLRFLNSLTIINKIKNV